MKPTPAELIAAVRNALRPLGAELSAPETRAALRRVLYVLREGRWNEAAFDLLAENENLALAADRVAAFLSCAEAAADARTPRTFAQANARNLVLRERLSSLLQRLDERDLAHSAELRVEIAMVLRRGA